MQLKQSGKQVKISLHKPELRQFAKVQDLLEAIALLPCQQKGQAGDTAQVLAELAKSMTKLDPQKELPFDTGEEAA